MALSVTHVSFSQSGGAGKVAQILTDSRNAEGLPTSHVFSIKGSLWSEPLLSPRHTAAAALDRFVVKSARFGAPISIFRDSLQSPVQAKFEEADVLHLHSINGLLTPKSLATNWPSKKIVWTLHDMNPMTGACHYSLGCEGYLSSCESCPAVRGPFRNRVSVSLDTKMSALAQLERIQLVAPSKWLAKAASESMALSRFPVSIIPNPLDPLFLEESSSTSDSRNFDFLIVAQNLADPVKNVRMAVEAFRKLTNLNPGITLALVGKNASAFSSEGVIPLGVLSGTQIAETFARAGTLLVPSLAENSPLVIAEAAAKGVSSLVHHEGGMPEMVEVLGSGSTFTNERELFESMASLVTQEMAQTVSARKALSERSARLYSPTNVSAQYDLVYGR